MSRKSVSYEQLVAYAAGELPPHELFAVEAALADDPAGTATVARLRSAIQALRTDDSVVPPADVLARAKAIFSSRQSRETPRWWENLAQTVARLVFDSRLQPALAGYRGAEEGFQLAYASEPAEVDLQVQPAGTADIGQVRLLGQVTTQQEDASVEVVLTTVEGASVAAQTRADAHGVFSLSAPSGTYNLLLRFPDQVVVLPDIEMA